METVLQETRRHYDDYPYEVAVRDSSGYLSQNNPIGRFVARIQGGGVLDIGCGPGNLLPILARCASRVVGFDLSRRSLALAAQAISGSSIRLVQGNALALPFADQSFECVTAAGSLHHTPDAKAAFLELCRVLRPQGIAFLSLYRDGSYYSFLYRTVGALARRCERMRLTAVVVNRCLILPFFVLYFLAGRFLVHRRLVFPSRAQIMNYFADQLLNPVVSFHRVAEVSRWATAVGVETTTVAYTHAGALINLEMRRLDSSRSHVSQSGGVV